MNSAALAHVIGHPSNEGGTESPHKRPKTGAAADPEGKATDRTDNAAVSTAIELSDDDASNDAPRRFRRAWSKSFDDVPDAQEASPEMTSRPLHQQSSACSEDEYAFIPSQDSVKSCDDAALMQGLADSLKQITVHF